MAPLNGVRQMLTAEHYPPNSNEADGLAGQLKSALEGGKRFGEASKVPKAFEERSKELEKVR